MTHFNDNSIDVIYNSLMYIPESQKSDIRFYSTNKRLIQTKIKNCRYILSHMNTSWSEEQLDELVDAVRKKYQQMINN